MSHKEIIIYVYLMNQITKIILRTQNESCPSNNSNDFNESLKKNNLYLRNESKLSNTLSIINES